MENGTKSQIEGSQPTNKQYLLSTWSLTSPYVTILNFLLDTRDLA